MPYSKTKIWIIVGITTTLFLGFILGVTTDRALSLKRRKNWLAYKGKTAKVLVEERLLKRLSRKLELTRPQVQAIRDILRSQSIKIKQLREGAKDKMNLIRKETHEKIKLHLLPNQQQKYDKLIALHRKRWKRISHRLR